jgi:hypothetical protein
MRQHLLKFHKAASAHHELLAKRHSELASAYYGASTDGAGTTLAKSHQRLGEIHEKLAGHHQEHSDFHAACAKSLEGGGASTYELPDVDEETRLGSSELKTVGDDMQHFASRFRGVAADAVRRGVFAKDAGTGQLSLIGRFGGPRISQDTDPTVALDEICAPKKRG